MRTDPAEISEKSPWRVARLLQLTDCHIRAAEGDAFMGIDTAQSLRDTLKVALAGQQVPDLILLTGDLVQDVRASAYQRLLKCLASLPCPAACLPGNHDDPELMAEQLGPAGIHFQPHIRLGGWLLICLDSRIPGSPKGRLAAGELERLAALLEQNPDTPSLIALHHHPVPSGSRWMDTMVLENADEFFAILDRHEQVRAVVFGHVHQEMDIQDGNRRVMGTPSTCFQFKPGQNDFALDALPPGYRWIDLHPDGRIETRVGRTAVMPEGMESGSSGY